MTENEEYIYSTIYNNSIIFLKRGIKETFLLTNFSKDEYNKEAGLFSSLFIQMSIELALKAFLIKKKGIKTILQERYKNKTDEEILALFINDKLHTKRFQDLKEILIDEEYLTWFSENHFAHLEQFQQFRNKIVHLNLFLANADLFDLRHEITFVIVHIIIPLLSEIDIEFETPTEFYDEYLDKSTLTELISFPPYVEEMERLAKEFGGNVYYCPECFKKTYSTENHLCYCCNLNYKYTVEYTDCPSCNSKKSIVFDYLNIGINSNVIKGLCLNCGTKINVFKCPKCEEAYAHYFEDELKICTPKKCFFE